MSLLLQEPPIVFTPSLAVKVGLNEAIFLQKLYYWVMKHQEDDVNFFDGRYWVYNSLDQWLLQFPFFSKSTLQRAIQSLVKQGLILKGNYNQHQHDRTVWYALNETAIEALEQSFTEERKAKIGTLNRPAKHQEDEITQLNTNSSPYGQNDHMDISENKNENFLDDNSDEMSCGQNDHMHFPVAQNSEKSISNPHKHSDGQNDHMQMVKLNTSMWSECSSPDGQNDHVQMVKLNTPIPYNTHNNNIISSSSSMQDNNIQAAEEEEVLLDAVQLILKTAGKYRIPLTQKSANMLLDAYPDAIYWQNAIEFMVKTAIKNNITISLPVDYLLTMFSKGWIPNSSFSGAEWRQAQELISNVNMRQTRENIEKLTQLESEAAVIRSKLGCSPDVSGQELAHQWISMHK